MERAASGVLTPGAVLCNAMLVNCRARFLPGQGETLKDLAAATWHAAEQMFGPFWHDAWKLANRAPDVRSTREATDLATAVFELLQLSSEPDEPNSSDRRTGQGDVTPSGSEDSDGGGPSGKPARADGKAEGEGIPGSGLWQSKTSMFASS